MSFSTILFFHCVMMGGFVCVEVLRPSQPNGIMSSAISLPSHTFTGQSMMGGWCDRNAMRTFRMLLQ